jgi:TonB-linked SusC/RagA family outer membrane protein
MKNKLYSCSPLGCINLKAVKTSLLLLFSFTFITALAGGQVLDKRLTFSFKNTEIHQVITYIQGETNTIFVYSPEAIDASRRISVDVSGKKLGDILDDVFKPLGISYKEMNGRILLYRVDTGENVKASTYFNRSSQVKISGRITDEKGEGMPGVSISIKGTATGTVSDVEGKYTIEFPEDYIGGVLVFSFVGYQTQEIKIGAQTVINIQMVPAVTELEDVVIVGYGQQRKTSLVGSQSSVSAIELKQPVANVSTTLSGRISGVVAVQRSGLPGSDGADIWIRGISTFGSNNSSQPLVLVDGVERSMDNIDPQDIESMQVLKDASATAVYGVRGANGVILFKTKSGAEGKPRFLFDYNQGITTFTKVPDLADGVTYMELANEALTTRGLAPKYTQSVIDNTRNNVDPLVYPNVNWMDEVFNKYGSNRQANLNVSGGFSSIKYYVSLGYYDETGFFKTDALASYNSTTRFSRYNVTSNLNIDVTKTTKIDLGIRGYFSRGNYPGVSASSIFSQTMWVPPVEYPVMYPGGYVPGRNPNGDQRNPYAEVTKRGYQTDNRNQLYSNLRVSQDLGFITKGLSVTGMFSFDAFNRVLLIRDKRLDTYITDPTTPRNIDGTLNLIRTYTGQNYLNYDRGTENWSKNYGELSLLYDRAFGSHRIGGMLLFNASDEFRVDYRRVISDSSSGLDFANSIPYRQHGLAGRATYSFREKYFAEFNFGYNGSENFSPAKRYGFFPAMGLGWIISKEGFFEPVKGAVQFLKIRYTDGIVGIGQGGRRFLYQAEVGNDESGYTFGVGRTGYGGIAITDYAVDVTWSETRKQDIGLELNTFNDRLKVIVDLFKERREGILIQREAVPDYMGLVNAPYGNLGITENKGIDGTIEYNGHLHEVGINLRGTFTFNKDKIIEDDRPQQPYPWMDHRGNNILARYGYIAEGLYKSDDEVQSSAHFAGAQAGDIRYKDLNNDGEINAYDVTRIGRGDVPALTYGFALTFSYKGFDISGFFQGQHDADIMLDGMTVIPFDGDGGQGNLLSKATDRWTESNPDPNAFYPRLAYGGSANTHNTYASTWWVKDISFMRLKTAELGYNLPSAFVKRYGMGSCRFYLRGVNLFTISQFKLWDPELLTSNGGAYPNVTVCSLGLNINF